MIHSILMMAAIMHVLADYNNGKLSEGEEYINDIQYRHPSFTVYRLPFGITFHQILETPGSLQTFLTHTPCPGGASCSYDRSDFWSIQFSQSKLAVQRKVSLAKYQYFQPLDQALMNVRYIDESAYLLSSNLFNGNTDGKLIKIRKVDGIPEEIYSNPLHPLFGHTDMISKLHYIFTTRHIVEVIDSRLQLVNEVSMTPHFDSVYSMDSRNGFLFVVGLKESNWKITKFNTTTFSFTNQMLPTIEKYKPSKCIIHPTTGNIFITIQNATSKREDYLPQETMYLYRLDENMSNFVSINFTSKMYLGHTWTTDDTLYLLDNVDLVKIIRPNAEMIYRGKMRIRSSWRIYPTSRENNIPLCSIARMDDKTLVIGAEWVGNLIFVNLAKFVDINDELRVQSIPNGGSIAGIVFAILFSMCSCGLIILVCFVAIFGVTRYSRRYSGRVIPHKMYNVIDDDTAYLL
jgi:hypothetical protein